MSPLTVGPGSTALLSGLSPTTPVSFIIRAVNDVGTGLPSNQSGTVQPAGRPDAPAAFAVTTTGVGGQVKVSFNESITHGTPVTQYTATITCTPTCANAGPRPVTPGEVITGFPNGTEVTVSVVADSVVGSSTAVSGTVTTPVPPKVPDTPVASLTGVPRQVLLRWTMPADPAGGSTITSYEARALTPATTVTAVITTCPGGSPVGSICGLVDMPSVSHGTISGYKVRAISGVPHLDDGNATTFTTGEGWSLTSNTVTTPNVPANPAAPGGNTITSTVPGSLTIGFSPSTNANGSPIDYHEVRVTRVTGALLVATVQVPVTDPSTVNVTGLVSGLQYRVQVFAHNAVGYSGARQLTPNPFTVS